MIISLSGVRRPKMIKSLCIFYFLVALIACASQETLFVPFERADYQMAISFKSVQLHENGDWLITGRVKDKQSGNGIPNATVFVAKYRDIKLDKPPEENPFLRAGIVTDREGYFEILSADIKQDDFILFKYIGFIDKVYVVGDLMETYKGERND